MTPLVFLSSAPEDSTHRDALVKHLAPVLHEGAISLWHMGRLHAGVDAEAEIHRRLSLANLIVLLITADYLASDACRREVDLALERAQRGEARVVPVLVRPCLRHFDRIAKLHPLPSNGKAVTTWPNEDEAWTNVAVDLHRIVTPETVGAPSWYEPIKVQIEASSRESLRMRRPLDDKTIALLAQLEDACTRSRRVRKTGADVTALTAEIRNLKRRIREGGQLKQGDIVGERYTLLRYIGHGGFANVWEAEDRKKRRRVALKVLHPNLAEDPEKLQRFQRGARAMASLSHDAVVRILDERVEDGGYHCFAMELIHGGTLQKAILDRAVPRERIFPLLLRVCDALVEAHGHHFVHHDVKPANILLDDGQPRLTDFDLVFTGGSSTRNRSDEVGTLLFAGPEMSDRPQDADVRADVYSMGMTVLFCLHGGPPPLRHLDRVLDALPGQHVADVLRKAIAQKPEERYQDMRSFREALAAAHTKDASGWTKRVLRKCARLLPFAGPAMLLVLIAGYGVKRVVIPPDLPLPEERTSDAGPPSKSPSPDERPPAEPPSSDVGSLPEPPACHGGMIGIPGGEVWIGKARDEKDADADETEHRVVLGPFCIDVTEVTVGQLRKCSEDKAGRLSCGPVPRTTFKSGEGKDHDFWSSFCTGSVVASGREDHPINCVDWATANRYCRWRGARLPTEAEWEYAARGKERRLYPWGSARPTERWLNACGSECRAMAAKKGQGDWGTLFSGDDGWPSTAPVGVVGGDRSAFGVRDMGGNISEWVQDWYAPYAAGSPEPPLNPVREEPPDIEVAMRVTRGGNWESETADHDPVRAAYRSRNAPDTRSVQIGFRCAAPPLPAPGSSPP